MSTLNRVLLAIVLVAGISLALPSGAEAQWRHHHHRGWHGGFGPGFALGFGLGYGVPYYYPPPYYARECGWVRERRWRRGYWRWRRVWRCW